MLLRNIRSRTVSGKQAEAVMTDHPTSKTPPTQNQTSPISPLFGNSPRLFTNFTTKYPSDPESVVMMSPTSILDTKTIYSSLLGNNPFNFHVKNIPKPPQTPSGKKVSWVKPDSESIGLALVDSLSDENPGGEPKNSSSKVTKKVLFGSQLKIQIPPLEQFNHSTTSSTPSGSADSQSHKQDSAQASILPLSMDEMELSELYTCVITHGPNPRTTHIYDDCIVESCCGVSDSFAVKKKKQKREKREKRENLSFAYAQNPNSPLQDFLSYCHTCKRKLGQEKDIFMYRGEKAFCSHECRSQEMLFDGVEEF